MADYASTSLLPPKDWQAFERCCKVLFECILKDPSTSLNGRTGQPQHGVDIWGKRNGSGGHYVGVQCKGKDSNYGKKVTERELRKEIEKARHFTPTIREFFLVTTAPDDAEIQKIARQITQENEESANPIDVTIWGWGNLQNLIIQYPKAIQAFHPDLTPYTDEILNRIADLKTEGNIRDRKLDLVLEKLRNYNSQNTSDTATKTSELVDSYLHSDIDVYRDYINNGRAQTALDLLEKLKTRCWDEASSRVRFRITTNIGAAKLQLGDEEDAADTFLAATEYDHTDKIGMANAALAHLIKDNIPKAIEQARSALTQDPTNADAASYLIQAHMNDDSIEDPFTLVSQKLHNTPAIRMGVIVFLRRRKNHKWRKEAREAFSLFPDIDELKRAAAEADLDEIMESRWVLLGQNLPNGFDVEMLHTVAKHLKSLWDKHKTIEGPLIDASLPHNLAIAYRALGDHEFAGKILEEALAKNSHAVHLVRERAAIHLVLDEDGNALKLLQEKAGNDPDAALMIAEQLLKKDPKAARKVLDDIDTPETEESVLLSASFLKADSYFREEKPEIGLEQANILAEKYPERIEVLVFIARCQRICGEPLSDETLTRVMEMLDETSSFYDRFITAKELEKQQRYDDMVDVLNGWVDLTRDTPALRMLLPAMINSDRRQRAHDAIRKLPQNVAEKPFYLRVQSAVHSIRGDYTAAEEVIDKYLKLFPEDLFMRLKWLSILRRRNADPEIRTFLEGNIEKLEGDPLDRMYLSKWLQQFGFEERSLKLGYEVLINNQKNPEIHLQYMGLLLLPSSTETVNLEGVGIGPNVFFTIKNKRGESDSYLIEPDKRLRIDPKIIAPDHLIAKKAFGLRIGDTFVIDEKKDPQEEWRIISMKHKYLNVLHSSMESFERQFPEYRGIELIKRDPKASSTNSLKPILNRLKGQHDLVKTAFDQYEHNKFPLDFISHSFGGDIIDTLGALRGSGRSFRVCMGSFAERNTAFKAIDNNGSSGCVVDILTLHIIRRLGIEDAISAICGPIGITESSIDVLRLRKAKIASHIGKPFMSLFWKDGQCFREEITEELLQEALKTVNNDLDWIGKHCEILPAEGKRDVPPEIRKISDVFGKHFFDSILAAEGSTRLLLCEDYAYRLIGTQKFELDSTWLQPVLIAAKGQNFLSMNRYVEAIFQMIEEGFRFISIDAQVLLTLGQDANDPDGRKFGQVAEVLGGPDADILSHIRVAAHFFTKIWEKQGLYPSLQCQAQTGKILECLVRNRGEQIRIITETLLLFVLFPFTSSRYNGFLGYLDNWLKGHFLRPLDT